VSAFPSVHWFFHYPIAISDSPLFWRAKHGVALIERLSGIARGNEFTNVDLEISSRGD
jgi:hypothetical protein